MHSAPYWRNILLRVCSLTLVTIGGFVDHARLHADDESQSATNSSDSVATEFFETHIRPVLIENCYSCHSADAKILRGGLRLDSREGMRRGGESGPAVVAGDLDKSLIIASLRHESFEMPPNKKLDDKIVDRFAQWIKSGAIDPRVDSDVPSRIDPVAARDHWAFQPVRLPSIPHIQDRELANWVQNPIDAFIADALSSKGWRPAAEADKYTLIRRATFDLIGLPPSPKEIQAFIDDDAPGSFGRVVDRLLDSPHYGERWGRHWLDLVRYADTNGADENHAMPNAWKYRDWVFQSMNRDQPLDEFIVHQLAGDLLTDGADLERQRELWTATGMLVIGPKMLAEQDKEKMRIDIVDEQIDTISRTIMGMTIACARCHDHKFDPITAEDYYAIGGIFASTRTMLHEDHVSQWLERDLPSAEIEEQRRLHQAKIDEGAERLKKLTDDANAAVLANLETNELPDDSADHYPKETKTKIADAKKDLEATKKAMPPFESVMAVTEGEPVDLAVHVRGNHLRKAEQSTARGVPQRIAEATPFRSALESTSGRLELARWLTCRDHVLTGRVMSNRLWMWHFGQSLVASPSNFGLQCPRPLHANLLDWLTRQLIDGGWSLKRMHRMIMLSNTYRMSSRDTSYIAEDPGNEYWWRQNRRRLEVEPLRDSILDVGDSLDRRIGGAPVGMESKRRTVYLTINRAALFDLLSTFDYFEPANHIEQRSVSTVPSQALFLLNHSLVHEQANQFAQRLLETEPSNPARLTALWIKLYGRPPTDSDLQLASDFLDQATRPTTPQEAWSSLCRTLIAGSMFSYVE